MLELIVIAAVTRLLFSETRRCGVSAWWTALGPVLYIAGELQGTLVAAYLGLDTGAILRWALSVGGAGALASWALIVFHPRRNNSSKTLGNPTSR